MGDIELSISADISESLKQIAELSKELKSISASFKALGSQLNKTFSKLNQSIKTLSTTVQNLGSIIKKDIDSRSIDTVKNKADDLKDAFEGVKRESLSAANSIDNISADDFNFDIDLSDVLKSVGDAAKEIPKRFGAIVKPIKDRAKSIIKPVVGVFKSITVGALKQMKALKNRTLAALNSIRNGFFSLKTLAAAAVGLLAGRALISGIGTVTDAASVQEDAINSLNTALKTSGEFSEEASRDLQDYASAIQESTKFGDELVLQQLALAKAFGASNEQAKQVVTAATELAASTGKSLDEDTRQVSKTLGGFAGELGEVNPAIKALTTEQLQAGEAARVLIEQYGGSAAAQINTFSGAVGQTSNTFGDLLETIGSLITQNPVVIEAIKGLNGIFEDLIGFIGDNQSAIRSFIANAVTGLIRGFASLVGFVTRGTKAIADFILAALNISVVGDAVKNLGNGFKLIGVIAATAFEKVFLGLKSIVEVAALIPGVGDSFDPAIEALQAFESIAKDVGDELDQSIANSNPDNTALIETLTQVSTASEKVGDDVGKVFDDLADKVESVSSEPIEVEVKASVNASDNAGSDLGDSFLKTVKDGIPSITSGITGAVFGGGGANGVRDLFTQGASAALDSFAPGFGAAAKPVFDALARGPEFARSTIEGFVEGIPEILDNIARALPVIFETLAENSDEIIIALVKAAPALARAIQIEVPLALAKPTLWRDVATSLIQAVAKEITGTDLFFDKEKLDGVLGGFNTKFTGGLNQFIIDVKKPFQPLIDALDRLASAVPSFSSGGGGGFLGQIGGGISSGVQSFGNALGLASGGTVPQGFPNDSFPASLTSGELVVPRDDVRELRRFLANQNSGQNMDETNALLAMIAQNMGSNQNVQVSVSQDGLSEAILELNRNNERLA